MESHGAVREKGRVLRRGTRSRGIGWRLSAQNFLGDGDDERTGERWTPLHDGRAVVV